MFIPFPAFNAANSNCFCLLLSSSADEIHVQSDLNLEIEQSKTFHFFGLIKSLTELAGCFGSLSWYNMKHFPMNLVAFLEYWQARWFCTLTNSFCYSSSYIKSSVKLMRLYAWDHLLFFLHILLSHHLDKGSSLSHRSINTVSKLFWLTFVFFFYSNLAFLVLVLVRGLRLAV